VEIYQEILKCMKSLFEIRGAKEQQEESLPENAVEPQS